MADRADGPTRPDRHVGRLQRSLEEHVANALFRRLLRSRAHRLVSRWLLLLDYEGRRSGRRYTTPVAYARADGSLVVVTPVTDSTWWRNFRAPYDCTVWHRGAARPVTGRVVTDPDERASLLDAYREQHPLLGRVLGGDGADFAVVRFAVRGQSAPGSTAPTSADEAARDRQ